MSPSLLLLPQPGWLERGWGGQQKVLSLSAMPSRLWVMSKFKAEVQRQQTKSKPASFFAQRNGEGAGAGQETLEVPGIPFCHDT